MIDSWSSTGTQKPGIMNPQGITHTAVTDALAEIGSKICEYRGLPSAPVSNVPENLHDWGKYEEIKSEALQRID